MVNRPPFSEYEKRILVDLFLSYDKGITSASQLGDASRYLGKWYSEKELLAISKYIGYDFEDFRNMGRCLSLEQFFQIMSIIKSEVTSSDRADALNAFSAISASSESVPVDALQQVCDNFSLEVDARKLFSKTMEVDFARHSMMRPSTISFPSKIASEVCFSDFAAVFDGDVELPPNTIQAGPVKLSNPPSLIRRRDSMAPKSVSNSSPSQNTQNTQNTVIRRPTPRTSDDLQEFIENILTNHYLHHHELFSRIPCYSKKNYYSFFQNNKPYYHERRPETPQWVADNPNIGVVPPERRKRRCGSANVRRSSEVKNIDLTLGGGVETNIPRLAGGVYQGRIRPRSAPNVSVPKNKEKNSPFRAPKYNGSILSDVREGKETSFSSSVCHIQNGLDDRVLGKPKPCGLMFGKHNHLWNRAMRDTFTSRSWSSNSKKRSSRPSSASASIPSASYFTPQAVRDIPMIVTKYSYGLTPVYSLIPSRAKYA